MSYSDEQISINRMSLLDVQKKILYLIEAIDEGLGASNKSLLFAEDSGWNDKSYYQFNAKYVEAAHKIKEGLKICEDELIPEIKKIESIFVEWYFY